MCVIQVGFTSVSDYITYTWVKDDEVAFNEEVIQVSNSCSQVELEKQYQKNLTG